MEHGYIYILSNPAMPDIYKIGKTTRDVRDRIDDLYTTGVPFPFQIIKVYEVDEMTKTEELLHEIFKTDRINQKREFFKLDPIRVIKALELAHANDITDTISSQPNDTASSEEIEAGEQFVRSRRPNFNFDMLNVPIGAEIIYTEDETKKAKVVDNRSVSYNGEPAISLSKLTNSFLKYKVAVAPLPYWTYNGRNLKDIYDEINPIENN